ncbi:MAG: hypothetical protein QM302_02430 [Acidobacteriota bacterium]|nr:hypothetical protein [Acidobacteriota bacterium]
MARSVKVTRTTRGALSGDEAKELFSVVDETGHTNEETARRQHSRRKEKGASVEVDPLAGEDPSGADTDRVITRSAILFVSVFLVAVVLLQVGWGYVRRVTTSTLAEDTSIRSVVSALNMGVEWGGGFTQFPSEFTVQEADEHTHRIEVTVTDTSSSSELDAFATAQVQASALSVNALLNPNIDTVVYHVKVRRAQDGHFQRTTFFGYLRPTGATSPFVTFVWKKSTDEDGVRFDCAITGMDNATQERLHDAITSKSTPAVIINYVIGDNGDVVAENVLGAAQDDEALGAAADELIEDARSRARQGSADTAGPDLSGE